MSNNTPKFIFLFVVIGVALLSRFTFSNFAPLSTLSANEAGSSWLSGHGGIVALPTLGSTSDTSVGGASGEQTPTTVAAPGQAIGFVSGESTPNFSKVANTAPPNVNDASSLVADLSNGAPLLSLNTNARWPMASLTKLMTAVVAFDNMPLNDTVTITPQMFAVDPNEFTLQIGGVYTVSDLLHVLLLPSSNVAAEALAETYGRTQFLTLMNQKATQWGMTNTFYDDPSGLSAANQSTAHDLLLITQQIYQSYPQIFAITRVPHVSITDLTTGGKVAVDSIDNFSARTDFVGGKTGHTDEASGNLLTIFNYENHPLLILVLGTNDRFGDSTKLYNWVKANYR
jgi:D-alanyl-D-alanine carboxypeptidase